MHFYDVINGFCRLSSICLSHAGFRIRCNIGWSVNSPLSLPSWMKYWLNSSILNPDFAPHKGLDTNLLMVCGCLCGNPLKKRHVILHVILVPTVRRKVKLQFCIIHNGPMAMAFNLIQWLNIRKQMAGHKLIIITRGGYSVVGTEILLSQIVVGSF